MPHRGTLDPATIDEASENQQFLSDIESMVMMASGGELAESCREEAAPTPSTTRLVDIDFIGGPDVGTVIQTVSARLDEGETPGARTRCLVENMHLVSLAPPQSPGVQAVTLQFAVDDAGQIVTSMVEPPSPSE